MWIQVRTIDGKETRTVDDLSRLTKIESLRLKIQEIFRVSPEKQRLFYRGKQMEDGQTLFDYNVGLNDIVQLLIRPRNDTTAGPALQDGGAVESGVALAAGAAPVGTNSDSNGARRPMDCQPSTSGNVTLTEAHFGTYKIHELVDCKDISIGAWFEATVEKVTRGPRGQNGSAGMLGKSEQLGKRTNGRPEAERGRAALDSNGNPVVNMGAGPSTSGWPAGEEATTYHIRYDDYPENGVVEMCAKYVRPRARTLLKWDQLKLGQVVMVNYNIDVPEERGFWFDAEITALNEISRTKKEVRAKLLLRDCDDVLCDCKIILLDEIYKIERAGAPPLSAAEGPFKRKTGPECKHCKADPELECRFCSCCVCGGKQDAHMQLLCDECNMAFHIYCLTPPLATVPDDEDWYCPTCKNDTSEVVKAGEKLKASKKRAKMPSAHTESQRDWGKGMACVGRTKECTIVPSNHYGPIPGVPVGTTWKFRVQVSEAGVHRPHVGGIHGRSNDGSYSLVLAGGFEDEVDRGDEFTYTGSGGRDLSGNKRIGEHCFDQTLTHYNRALALNCDAPLNDKDGAESRNWRAGKPVRVVRSSKGRRISKYAPEEGNRYDGIYKVVKYWPEIGKCGFLVWRYLLRRDDEEPAPWTPEGAERIKKLGLSVQYPEGYLEAMANKTKKEVRRGTRGRRGGGRGRPRKNAPEKIVQDKHKVAAEVDEDKDKDKDVREREAKAACNNSVKKRKETDPAQKQPPVKRSKACESFQLSEQQLALIREDTPNKKLWDEALDCLKEGPNFLRKVEQIFMCVCCQELVFHPVTTPCVHNVCKACLQRSFRAEVYSCPACRHDLGKDYVMLLNKTLQGLLDQFFPGYSKGR
ncbi:E3 ubiquitin-protein ligase UHRF2-like isoform X1 [Paramormyrops kingsleyae]|uniref:E3 ubiquitin-protein ligase UHRF2-like isoform X1 n=1 Tax=Paramormyrops kingsleyae TaxID=1676925 RepID=UPI003B976836